MFSVVSNASTVVCVRDVGGGIMSPSSAFVATRWLATADPKDTQKFLEQPCNNWIPGDFLTLCSEPILEGSKFITRGGNFNKNAFHCMHIYMPVAILLTTRGRNLALSYFSNHDSAPAKTSMFQAIRALLC